MNNSLLIIFLAHTSPRSVAEVSGNAPILNIDAGKHARVGTQTALVWKPKKAKHNDRKSNSALRERAICSFDLRGEMQFESKQREWRTLIFGQNEKGFDLQDLMTQEGVLTGGYRFSVTSSNISKNAG
jgi:hypothetical protein